MTTDGQIKDGLELSGATVLSYVMTYHSIKVDVVEIKERSIVIKV